MDDDEPMIPFDDPEQTPICPICGGDLSVRTLEREFIAVQHLGFESTCTQCGQKVAIIYSFNVQESAGIGTDKIPKTKPKYEN